MKDDAQCVAAAGSHTADTVANVDAVEAARSLHWSVPDREDDAVAAAERDDLDARLHPRPLLGEDELAAGEVRAGLLQEYRDLEREDMFAVQVLMQTVEVIRAVLEHERRGLGLPRLVAAREELGMIGREAHVDAHRLVPSVGDLRQGRVERGSQLGDEWRQRIGEVAILAAAVAVSGHDHATAEGLVQRVKCRDGRALTGCK